MQALEAEIVVKDYHSIETTALVETRATIKAAQEALNAADQRSQPKRRVRIGQRSIWSEC